MKNRFLSRTETAVILIVFPLVYILIGALFQFATGIDPRVLLYVCAVAIVIAGGSSVARYFLSGGYRNTDSYEFTVGLFAVIVGICMISIAPALEEYVFKFIGACMLFTSIIKVQNALQLLVLKKQMWIPIGSVAILLIVADVLVLVNPFPNVFVYQNYTYILLMVDGVLSLVNNVYMNIVMRLVAREQSAETGVVAAEVYEYDDEDQDL